MAANISAVTPTAIPAPQRSWSGVRMMRRRVTSSGIALRQPPMRIATSVVMSSFEGAASAIAAPTSGLDCM